MDAFVSYHLWDVSHRHTPRIRHMTLVNETFGLWPLYPLMVWRQGDDLTSVREGQHHQKDHLSKTASWAECSHHYLNPRRRNDNANTKPVQGHSSGKEQPWRLKAKDHLPSQFQVTWLMHGYYWKIINSKTTRHDVKKNREFFFFSYFSLFISSFFHFLFSLLSFIILLSQKKL